MRNIPFHHIKNYGLAVMVAIQLWVVIVAIDYINENLLDQEDLNHRMTEHIESIHYADLAIGQAYNLFVFDINSPYVLPSHVAEPLKHGIKQLDRNIYMAGEPDIKNAFTKVRDLAGQIDAALTLYMKEEDRVSSDRELYAEVIHNNIDQVHKELLDLSMMADVNGLNVYPYRLQIVQQLFQVVDELFTQLTYQPQHQSEVIMQLLNDAEVALENTMFQPDENRVLPEHEMKLIRENIQKIKFNLPGIYENWTFDPNMSYIGDEVQGIREAWDNLYMTLNLLSVEETRYMKSERDRLAALAENRKQQLMVLFGVSVAVALFVAWLIRTGLQGRLRQLIMGIEEYVEDREFRLPVKGNDMLCQIGTSFNQMAEDLDYKELELKKTVEYLTSSQAELHELRANMEHRLSKIDHELLDTQEQLSAYEYLFEYASDGMLIVNAAGTIVQVNSQFTDLIGFTESELIGRRPLLFAPDSDDLRYEWGDMGNYGRIFGKVTLVCRDGKAISNVSLTWLEWNRSSENFNGAMILFQPQEGDA